MQKKKTKTQLFGSLLSLQRRKERAFTGG